MARVWEPLQYGWSVVYVLKIEGVSDLFSEGLDGSATGESLPATWNNEDPSLVIDGGARIGQRIDRDKGIGVGFPLSFRLLDTSTVRGWLKVWSNSATLTADLTASATTVTVNSTSGWPNSGSLWIGNEHITYTGLGGPGFTFTGCTRGVNGLAYAHDSSTTATAFATDLPRSWRGRYVELYAVPVDPTGYLPGSTLLDQAELVFRGHLSAGPDRVGDEWAFEALALDRILSRELSTAISGEVVDQEIRMTLNDPAVKVMISAEGFAAGVSQWDETLTFEPYAAKAVGDLVSEAEMMALWDSAFAAALAVASAGVQAVFEKSHWYFMGKSTKPYPHLAGLWRLGIELDADAAVDDVSLTVNVGGTPFPWEYNPKMVTGGIVADTVFWTLYYFSAYPEPQKQLGAPLIDAAAIELDEADPSDVAAGSILKIDNLLYSFDWKASANGRLYVGGLKSLVGAEPTAPLTGKTAEVYLADSGFLADVIRRQLMSSGTANLRNTPHDSLPEVQGYGLDETFVDVTGIEQNLDGYLKWLEIEVETSGESCESILCPLLALSGRALVAKPVARDESDALDEEHAMRISLVETLPSGGSYAATITDAEIVASQSTPVKVRRLRPAFNVITVKGIIGGEEQHTIHIRDKGRRTPGSLVFRIPMKAKGDLLGVITAWAKARFASDQSAREVTLFLVPWLDFEIGDLVRFSEVTHHNLVDLTTGEAGTFSGTARVLGSSIDPPTGLREVTVHFGGYLDGLALCPSAEVQAWSTDPAAPGVNDTISVPVKYLDHFARVIDEDGDLTLSLYNPGTAEMSTDPFGYTFDGIAESGGLCVLTISALLDGAETVTANLSRLTTPKTADASSYQTDNLMHDGDGSFWVGG